MFDWLTNTSGSPDLAPYLTLMGGSFGATSSILAGDESAKLLRANAAIAGMQGRSENEAGAESAELFRQRLNQTEGRQAAAIGGSNVTMSGSPLRSLENTALFGAQDVTRIQTNAARKAWGFETTEAGDEVRAQQAKSTGTMNAFGSLITTGARAYGQWSEPD